MVFERLLKLPSVTQIIFFSQHTQQWNLGYVSQSLHLLKLTPFLPATLRVFNILNIQQLDLCLISHLKTTPDLTSRGGSICSDGMTLHFLLFAS